jgi:drug/metabolite transporter (DMT)-like permease
VVGGGPLFVALLAHFITGKDPLTIRRIIGLLIGFSGIVLLALAKDKTDEDPTRTLIGILLLVTGNFAGSFGNILVSRNKTGLSPVFLTAVQIFFGGLMILIVSLFVEDFDMRIKPLPYYLALGWLSIISAAAFTLWFIVLSRKEVRVAKINVWKFMIPLLGAVISWLMIAGEKPEWYTVAGMVLIAASILIIYFRGILGYFFKNGS